MAKKLDNMTFLIGGMFSTGEREHEIRLSSRSVNSINWYKHLPDEVNFYSEAASYWDDVYGNNSHGYKGEEYFWWKDTHDTTYRNISRAADRLIKRIQWAKTKYGSSDFKVRLIGHSAGCLVANVASHRLPANSISQHILCAPPVPNSFRALKQWRGHIHEALPSLRALCETKFYIWLDS